MNNKRTKNSLINIFVIVVMQVMALLYSLISKSVFLESYSLSVYGVVDLFSSFFNSLMMLELGFGTVLIYNLYKPIASNDSEEIRRQLSLFKTIYAIISMIIFSISIISFPFIYDVFNISYGDKILVYEIYILNIISLLVKYGFLNKISILNASQTNYIQNISVLIVDFLGFIIKIVSILVFKNIYIYVFGLLLVPSLSYFIQTIWINKNYNVKGIKFASIQEVKNSEILSQMGKYVYATIYNIVFFSMDNIIISMQLSTDAIAYVSNYLIFFNIGGTFTSTMALSLRGIMADYRHNANNEEGYYIVFKLMSSLFFLIASIMVVGFYTLIDDFICLWIGEEFLIGKDIVIVLLLIRLIDSLCEPIMSVFCIEGYIFKEKFALILSALVNFVLTIILIKQLGIIGAYVATLIATLIKWMGKFYYVIYGVFKKKGLKIVLTYMMYVILIILESLFVKEIALSLMPVANSIFAFASKLSMVVLLSGTIGVILVLFDRDVKEYIVDNFRNKVHFKR